MGHTKIESIYLKLKECELYSVTKWNDKCGLVNKKLKRMHIKIL